MRANALLVLATTLIAAISAMAQGDSPKISNAPLTDEQLVIYRIVIAEYLKGSGGKLNLSNRTDPLRLGKFDKACARGIDREAIDNAAIEVHKFNDTSPLIPSVVFVDPDKQQMQIRQNDPENLMRKSVDDHEPVTNEQLDNSLKQAFGAALFSISEIAFDKQHRRAVVTYSFVCGMLCGHGNTLRLEKTDAAWKIKETCGGWQS